MNILHIDSSILGEQSVSRKLSAAVVARLRAAHPQAQPTYRDLAAHPVPQFSAALAAAPHAGEDLQDPQLRHDAATLAAALDEVLAADVVVIGAPMYNFSIPSQLKAWIDALAVPGKTFTYDASGIHGLLGAKRVIVASSRGNVYATGSPLAFLDHQESFLRDLFGFLGVTRFEIVRAEGVRLSPEAMETSLASGLAQVAALDVA